MPQAAEQTLVIYILWWDKPLDVCEPTMIQGDKKDEFLACHVVGSRLHDFENAEELQQHSKRGRGHASFAAVFDWCPEETEETNKKTDANQALQEPVDTHPEITGVSEDNSAAPTTSELENLVSSSPKGHRKSSSSESVRLRLGEYVHRYRFSSFRIYYKHSLTEVVNQSGTVEISLGAPAVRMFELADLRMQLWSDKQKYFGGPVRVQNFPKEGGIENVLHASEKPGLTVGLFVFGIAYAALHLSAWSAAFPNSAQHLMWRISSVTIALSGVVYLFTYFSIGLFVTLVDIIFTSNERHNTWAGITVYFGSFALPSLYLLLYLFSRVFLVVECFISLAYLPPSVYGVPSWSQSV